MKLAGDLLVDGPEAACSREKAGEEEVAGIWQKARGKLITGGGKRGSRSAGPGV